MIRHSQPQPQSQLQSTLKKNLYVQGCQIKAEFQGCQKLGVG
jgi:hypothetical protein